MEPLKLQVLTTDRDKWKFFWLKSVRDVDLSVHCARCLKGSYVKGPMFGKHTGPALVTMVDHVLDDAPFYYMCGVAYPYSWENNFHLAFKKEVGSKIMFAEKGVHGIIANAVRIPIMNLGRGESLFQFRNRKEYYTCRNWQFANQVAEFFGHYPSLPEYFGKPPEKK